MPSKIENLKRELKGKQMTRSGEPHKLTQLIRAGKNAQPNNVRYNSETDTAVTVPALSGVAQSNGTISLSRDLLPELEYMDGRFYRAPNPSTPRNSDAGRIASLQGALTENSRVVRAGSQILLLPTENGAAFVDNQSNTVAYQREIAEYVTIEAANIAAGTPDLNDEITVSASPLPVNSASVDREALTQRAVRFEIKRSEIKSKGEDQLSAEIMTAIALGIGRAVDEELLAAIVATTPANFSLAAAASAGLRFSELRGIVGTAGTGATTDQGNLYANGVAADTSADVAQTIIGAFDRAAVAVADDIQLIIERRDTAGGLFVTCWIDLYPLVADPSKFWLGA